ncbi:hypothetical protein ACETU7_35420 [Rhodococcus sp. 3Y1]
MNAVTNDAIDPASQQPEFKACAVTMTKVAVNTPETVLAEAALVAPAPADRALSRTDVPRRCPRSNRNTCSGIRCAPAELPGRPSRCVACGRRSHCRGTYLAVDGTVRCRKADVGRRCSGRPVLADLTS